MENKQTILDLAQHYDVIMLDCDGVLWSGPTQIGNAFETVQSIEAMGKQVFFISNSSGRTRA